MTIRRVATLILLLFLNLVLGFIYIQPSKIMTFISNPSNETEDNRIITLEVDKNDTSKKFTSISTTLPEFHSVISYKFSLNPQDLCSRGPTINSKLSLIILVCTAVPNAKERQAIRETWGSVAAANNNTGLVRLAFLLGSTNNTALQQQVKQESSKYADIIQQDFMDSYQNLTLKSIMLLKWVSDFCPNVQYVLKTDDDMYVNVPNLIKSLLRLPVKSNVMYGVLFRKAKPNRNSLAKWFVPKSQFEADTFPDYLSGTGYVMTRDVVPKLLEASTTVPFLVMEDVFITGLCASECNVKRYNVRGFAHWKRPATACAFKDVITGHHVTVSDMMKIWKEFQKKPLVCHLAKKKVSKQ